MPTTDLKIIAVIQARLGSTRLPGKALIKIAGRNPIEWIKYRLSFCHNLDGVVLSTVSSSDNDQLAELASRIGLDIYRGSESDLVARIYQTAGQFGADAVVRITADCPLVDPQLVDKMVAFYRQQAADCDYVCNVLPRTFPHGLDLEIISTASLARLSSEVTDPVYRENITTTIMENPDSYRVVNFNNDKNLASLRLTLDYPEDLELITKIFNNLHQEGRIFNLDDILGLFQRQPQLLDINRHRIDLAAINQIEGQEKNKTHFIRQEQLKNLIIY